MLTLMGFLSFVDLLCFFFLSGVLCLFAGFNIVKDWYGFPHDDFRLFEICCSIKEGYRQFQPSLSQPAVVPSVHYVATADAAVMRSSQSRSSTNTFVCEYTSSKNT
ncbi:uncharacterized protein [Rutidosis leptorrhynchoides]|uniref:uncharacterized protein n=1 Tax=Rutidosis leptorrhynchoides TaxID=125765 RepID=UPI003A9A30B3